MHAIHWKKSTYSGAGSNCVEISPTPTQVHIRDSKTPQAPHLTVPTAAWADFVAHTARRGD